MTKRYKVIVNEFIYNYIYMIQLYNFLKMNTWFVFCPYRDFEIDNRYIKKEENNSYMDKIQSIYFNFKTSISL